MAEQEPEKPAGASADTDGDDSVWVRVPHHDWREADEYALNNPPSLLRHARAARLSAVAILRDEAWAAVQRDKPQAAQELEQCLRAKFSEYALRVFDRMAETRLRESVTHGRPRAYGRWLRSSCLPAVLDDVCRPSYGLLPTTLRCIAEKVGEVHWPEDLVRMRSTLWRTYADEVIPGSFTRKLESYVGIDLENRSRHWEAEFVKCREEGKAVLSSTIVTKNRDGRSQEMPDGQKVAAAERQEFMTAFLKKRSLSGIAKGSGVIYSSLHRWYNGKSKLSTENAGKLAEYLKVETVPN